MHPRHALPLILCLFAAACASRHAESPRAAAPTRSTTVADLPTGVEQRLIYNANLEYVVDETAQITRGIDQVRTLAKEVGGYVHAEYTKSIVVRVPNPRFADAMTSLASIAEVTSRNVRVQDVTEEFADLAIRVENSRKLQKRLTELLTQTKNVPEILEVEKELARVTEQLERLEGQARLLENRTAFATITASFETDVSPGPVGWVFYGLYKGVKWLFVWD